MAFFLLHALMVIGYVYLSRNHAGLLKAVPTPAGILIVNLITFATSPLCACAASSSLARG
jgi:hypothetical protein